MSLRYDPEWFALAGPKLETQSEVLPIHDIATRRSRYAQLFVRSTYAPPADINIDTFKTPASDGHEVVVYRVSKKTETETAYSSRTPAVLHIHGGGFISVHAKDVLPSLVPYVRESGIPIFSVDYRWAPENPFPTPVEDCWSGLLFLHSRSEELGIDVSRIAVMGESAGGGLAAGLALLARDRNLSPALAKQILIYPMLDDRTITDRSGGLAVFSINDVITGWAAYIGEAMGTDNVSPIAAPARVGHVAGLPSLYLDVGQLDLFLGEDVAYARKFLEAHIQTELHVYPGVIHAFQRWAPTSQVVKQVFVNRLRAITTIEAPEG
ncbi:Alpha/Beta hydrolase protein [Dactylonectria estremocensis]|uniref:Alpha/Beta hydrolase protein n=1 Tax=Dactylonectria estremocensis TaxID=1079267 RepID=A0A9P9J1Y9_9HYPO|nr:Alpha/Beta hydrolase protein [Dactylonectria estremocensis]